MCFVRFNESAFLPFLRGHLVERHENKLHLGETLYLSNLTSFGRSLISDGYYITGEFDGYSCGELLVAGVGISTEAVAKVFLNQ
jgi:spermidine synthase